MINVKSLVRPSALSGNKSGKALSDGWVVNFAVGCAHGCVFCYARRITELLNPYGLPKGAFARGWGRYLYVPDNLAELIESTPWRKWSGVRLLMSSTHDPYLPQLYFPHRWPRRILETALPHGVRFTVLTRSALVLQDLDVFAQYRDQVRVYMSIPTLDVGLTRLTEPGAPPPQARLATLRKVKGAGVETGVVVAPIIPAAGWETRLRQLFEELAKLRPSVVYGEMLHPRGSNTTELRRLGLEFELGPRADRQIGQLFEELLQEHGLKGEYWYEYDESSQAKSE
ncbi:MAG: radical SAM protein [Thermoproteus sp.]